MSGVRGSIVALLVAGCVGSEEAATGSPDAGGAGASDSGPTMPEPDPEPAVDLAGHRDRLFSGLHAGADLCDRWNQLHPSGRAVFLTLTDRLHRSTLPDGTTMLERMERLLLVLGGGGSGDECGGSENNRLFLSMDPTLFGHMVDTWDERERVLGDGGGATWHRTKDLAGPHAPMDASIETESGLRCLLLVELPDSRPPTAQAHFFQEGSATRVERGPEIDLDADPYLLEIDHDFDCIHRSNPLCPGRGFDDAYREHYGDFECGWVPAGCVPAGDGCYPDAA